MNWYILAIIPVLGLLVFVHEFGHFITAKWAGMRVDEFAIGFPPAIVSFRKRARGGLQVMWLGRGREIDASAAENPFGTAGSSAAVTESTIYSLNLLPIGGYVRLPGQDGDPYDAEGNLDPKSFAAKSASKRIMVLLAGVVMNILLAMLLFMFAYGLGEPTYSTGSGLGLIEPNSPAAAAGLRVDDTILAVNGVSIHSFEQMRQAVSKAISADKTQHPGAATVAVTVDARHSNGQTFTTTVNARVNPAAGTGAMGVGPQVVQIKTPLWQAPIKGITRTFDITRAVVGALVQMITGQTKVQLAGPVGVAPIIGEVAQQISYSGWWDILNLTAALSLNLAIFNILPFPALDGGRILLILIEIVRGGKRLKPESEGIINFVGIAILLLLMIVVTVSDVIHLGS